MQSILIGQCKWGWLRQGQVTYYMYIRQALIDLTPCDVHRKLATSGDNDSLIPWVILTLLEFLSGVGITQIIAKCYPHSCRVPGWIKINSGCGSGIFHSDRLASENEPSPKSAQRWSRRQTNITSVCSKERKEEDWTKGQPERHCNHPSLKHNCHIRINMSDLWHVGHSLPYFASYINSFKDDFCTTHSWQFFVALGISWINLFTSLIWLGSSAIGLYISIYVRHVCYMTWGIIYLV